MSENQIRCFIAAKLPDDLLGEIDRYTAELARHSPGIRWVKPESIHLTLKFLGEISLSTVQDVRQILTGISTVAEPFDLIIKGSGTFPNRRQPRVIWLGLEHDPSHSLFKLHDWLDAELVDLGFEKEKRRFSPHLTLGRVKLRENFGPLFRYLDRHPFPERTFRVDKIYFIRSSLQPSGAVYTIIADHGLSERS